MGVLAALYAWLAAAGCGSDNPPPLLESRSSLDYVLTDLYTASDGFSWWDGDIQAAGATRGKITLIGDQMVANGGGCGVYGWGPCDATLTGGRIEIHLPDRNGSAGNYPQLTFGLQRVSGAIQLDDGAGGILLSLQPTPDGNATITGRTGVEIATTQKSTRGIQVLSSIGGGAYIGTVDSHLPPEIAALALGEQIDTSGNPHIPEHAVVVAAAMTWLQ
jgi:hypothetical protein